MDIKVFPQKNNDGTDNTGRYSNQCMWLSILDFLNGVMGNNYNLTEIREIASSNNTAINGENEELDTLENYGALLNVVNSFDLQIHLYNSFKTNSGNLFI